MEGTQPPSGARSAPEPPASGGQVDWVAAEQSPEFRELVSKRRAFVLPATIFFLAWYLGFILLAGYAPEFLGESIYEGFTVGYAFALTQFVMVWVLSWLYLKRADKVFDPLAKRAADRAGEVVGERRSSGGGVLLDPPPTERRPS